MPLRIGRQTTRNIRLNWLRSRVNHKYHLLFPRHSLYFLSVNPTAARRCGKVHYLGSTIIIISLTRADGHTYNSTSLKATLIFLRSSQRRPQNPPNDFQGTRTKPCNVQEQGWMGLDSRGCRRIIRGEQNTRVCLATGD